MRSIWLALTILIASQFGSRAHASYCDWLVIDHDLPIMRHMPQNSIGRALGGFIANGAPDSSSGPLSHIDYYTRAAAVLITNLVLFGDEKTPLTIEERTILADFIPYSNLDNFILSDNIVIDYDSFKMRDTLFCAKCELGHAETLIRPIYNGTYLGDSGRTVLIDVAGIGIVGAVKQTGDATFIALKDVRNSEGKPVLIRGLVYDIDVNLLNDELRYYKRAGEKFAIHSVSGLNVRPGRFTDLTNPAFVGILHNFDRVSAHDAHNIHRLKWRDFQNILTTVLHKLETEILPAARRAS